MIAAMEPLSLGIYTWFMKIENYDELRLQGSTNLLVPLLPGEPYDLPVYVILFHEAARKKVKCALQRPYVSSATPLDIMKRSDHVWHYTKQLTRMRFLIKSSPEKSGTYTVKCQGKYYYPPETSWFPVHVEKDITIRFERGKYFTTTACLKPEMYI